MVKFQEQGSECNKLCKREHKPMPNYLELDSEENYLNTLKH